MKLVYWLRAINIPIFPYVVLFVDDCSRICWVYFLKHKYEVFDVFVKFYNMILTQFHAKPKILRSDNGGEYISVAMKQIFLNHGLVHQTSCPNTPQQKGLLNAKTVRCLRYHELSCLRLVCLSVFGSRLLLLPPIS